LTAEQLSRSRLYGILDLGYVEPRRATEVAEALVAGAVDCLQLRAKDYPASEITKLGKDLRAVTTAHAIPLVVNDYAEVARDLGAEGLHLGQDDISIADARAIVGADCAIGKSTHSIDQAIHAFYEGADYIGFGPIFATPTKPDYPAIGLDQIQTVHDAVRLPIFCIGGIKLDNLAKVLEAGARRVVIVSGLLQATDIVAYARAAKDLLNRKSKIANS
jgi:thiamine-phosphate pyrophosphorylase